MPLHNNEDRKRYAREWAKRKGLERKRKVMEYYGNKCACCGETELIFLSIDHINGGGNAHRRKIGVYGRKIYDWIIVNNFPEGFQVLCHNCNFAKSHWPGGCPHNEK